MLGVSLWLRGAVVAALETQLVSPSSLLDVGGPWLEDKAGQESLQRETARHALEGRLANQSQNSMEFLDKC